MVSEVTKKKLFHGSNAYLVLPTYQETNTTETHYTRLTQHNHLVLIKSVIKSYFKSQRLVTKVILMTSSLFTSS